MNNIGITVFLLCLATLLSAREPEAPSIPRSNITSMTQNPDGAFKKIKQDLNNALEDGDNFAQAVAYRQIGELYYYQAAYLQALDNFYRAESLFKKLDSQQELAGIWIKIGETNYYNRQYAMSLEAFEHALDVYTTLDAKRGIADALAHIGQVHEKKKNLEEAKKFQYRALQYVDEQADLALTSKIYENIGSIHEDRLELDSALFFFEKSLALSRQLGDSMAMIEIINNLGDVYRKTGNYPEARRHSEQAAALASELNEHYQLSSAYRDLSKIYALMGRYDSAYHYSEAGREIHVEIFSEDIAKQRTILQTLFELEQKDNAIVRYERERKIHYTMMLFGVAIVLLLIFLAVSVFSRQRLKIANQKQLNEKNKRLYKTEKHSMEMELHNKKLKAENLRNELELKSKELTSHTLHLIQKKQLLEELKEKLTAVVKSEKRDQRKELKQIMNMIQLNHSQEKNWDDFRIVFERVHEHFFDSLKQYSDALTASDLRLAALLKMNLGSADISTMLGISQDSLRIARYRLRKKMDLPEGESLTTFVQRL